VATSESYSELAILLAAPSADEDDNPDMDAVAWCDHKLREVREVLDGLIVRRWNGDKPITCWCAAIGDDEHSEACQRTQRLMSRLTPKEK
jgi:hypothetical protein